MRIRHFLLAALLPASLAAQASPAVDAMLAQLKADNAWTLAQQKSLCEIPAPPFKEAARAEEYRKRFVALGLQKVRVDAAGNVLAERPGSGRGPTIVLAGHLDTVFPDSTDVRVRESNGRMTAPGIGDNCRGIAVVLAVARAYQRANPRHDARIIFVGNVGEEGPGNLSGVRHLFETELKGQIDFFVAVDGAGTNVVSRAVGSNRYRVTYKGPGGHSYGAFGIPNPIHALGRAIALISEIQVPATPRTTFNVGIVQGGTSVNSIAFEASMDIDMRSESADALRVIDGQVRRAIQSALDAENERWPGQRAERARLSVVIDTIGIRPTGAQSDSARIVQVAVQAGRALGFTPATGASSTDANLPISLGVPGISIDGGGRASGAHSLAEWYEDGPAGWLGPQWAALIVAMLAGLR
ncbi:MAG TPA: M20/M25/M40 family metallo-hydrolase [Gemmatimonadaceae bacterium]|jgi:tripeptide aminopeptidase|nr:M20/M25/M40 family metallo-hydrolase [Gemmatimonadaceae bacterium]